MKIASNLVASAIQARFRKLRTLISPDLVDIQEEAGGPWGERPDPLYINAVSPDSEVVLVPLADPEAEIVVRILSVYNVGSESLLTGQILSGVAGDPDLGTPALSSSEKPISSILRKHRLIMSVVSDPHVITSFPGSEPADHRRGAKISSRIWPTGVLLSVSFGSRKTSRNAIAVAAARVA